MTLKPCSMLPGGMQLRRETKGVKNLLESWLPLLRAPSRTTCPLLVLKRGYCGRLNAKGGAQGGSIDGVVREPHMGG